MPSYKFLRVSVKVFTVLAWVAAGLNVVSGIGLLIVGGEPIPLFGVDLPARWASLFSFLGAGVYFLSFSLTSHLIQLLLDIREHAGARG